MEFATVRNMKTFLVWTIALVFSEQGNRKCTCVLYCIPDGENLSKVEVIIIDLSDKDGSEGFVKSCAIHVYGGTDREHKAGHPLVHLVVFL